MKYEILMLININNLNLHNILIDKKSYENTLIYIVAYKPLYGTGPLQLFCIKLRDILENMILLNI